MKRSKLIVIGLVAAFLLTICAAFAADPVLPSEKDTALTTIANVERTATVTAYRVIEPVYGEYGLVKYQPVPGANFANMEAPTQAEVLKLATEARKGTFADKVTYKNITGTDSFSADLPAGSWLVLVTDVTDAEYVYNPMLVSAYYTDANDADSLTAGTIDADGDFTIGGNVYYAKRSHIFLEKTIETANRKNAKYDDYAIGDTADFQINTMIPLYDEVYRAMPDALVFYLVDTQSKGLDTATDFVVEYSVDGKAWEAVKAADYVRKNAIDAATLEYDGSVTLPQENIEDSLPFDMNKVKSGNDWMIIFTPKFVADNAGSYIRVSYKAKVNEDAVLAPIANPNDVELVFTNDVYHHFSHLQDTVLVYTFTINQMVKIDEAGNLLSGAEFALIKAGSSQTFDKPYKTCVTDKDGRLYFEGLDDGVYQIQETKAPEGHFLNASVYTVTITPEYDAAVKKMSSYIITITDGTGKAVSKIPATGTPTEELTKVINPTLSKLPSTGGLGTKQFTLIGLLIVLFGAGIFVLVNIKRNRA